MSVIPLSILEFGYIKPPRLHAYETLNALFEEIAVYDELGYKRFWMSEHYSPEFAWYSPEMLLPLLAGYSEKIKIGWAGVLLHMHNPLLVANNFRLLTALFDDRIDLGVAAAGAAPAIKKILGLSPHPWPEQVKQLVGLVRGEWENEDGKKIIVPPHGTAAPSMWYLGTSERSIPIAVANKMNFALTFMHPGSNFSNNLDTIKKFKAAYFEQHNELPETSVLISSACTSEPRQIRLFEKRFSIEGFSNLFGDADYINEELQRLQALLENDEFCLYNPYCLRERRMESYSRIIQHHHDLVESK